MQAQFGLLKDGRVHLIEFYMDPDVDETTWWFEKTGEVVDLDDLREVGSEEVKHEGNCYDTSEYISQVGNMMKALVDKAPDGTKLVVLTCSTACGTRTFREEVNAKYYQ